METMWMGMSSVQGLSEERSMYASEKRLCLIHLTNQVSMCRINFMCIQGGKYAFSTRIIDRRGDKNGNLQSQSN